MFDSLPQRKKLLKFVHHSFSSSGWNVTDSTGLQDMVVNHGKLTFHLTCDDESILRFKSLSHIIAEAEERASTLKRRANRVSLLILDRNFLPYSQQFLLERGIVTFTTETMNVIPDLSRVSSSIPIGISDVQLRLLQGNIEYCVAIANIYRKEKNLERALEWARLAVTNSSGITLAYTCLFHTLREAADYAAAEEIGKVILSYRQNDPEVVRGLADIAKRRGDNASKRKWDNILIEGEAIPRTLEAILAKQRMQAAQSSQTSVPSGKVAKSIDLASAESWPSLMSGFIRRLLGRRQ